MESYNLLLLQVVLCVLCCVAINASTTLMPPEVEASEEQEQDDEVGYLLSMPQTLQAGAQENYCLTLHGATQDTTVTLALRELRTNEDGKDDAVGETYTYQHTFVDGENMCKGFQVPPMPGRYEVNLINEGDVLATSEVNILGNNLITFVQTDKPIYKPGQTVKFRIMTMTKDLRSRVGLIESVFIKDPNDYKVKKFANVDSRGMASLDFQLIREAKLGQWSIEVTVEGETTTQTFSVEEYVLPRFEVTVTPPTYFTADSTYFNGTVCAKYTYGKAVKGFMTVKVCPMNRYYHFQVRPGGPIMDDCTRYQAEINGCQDFSIALSELLGNRQDYFYPRFNINATVTEQDTAVQVNGSALSPAMSLQTVKIEFLGKDNYFKPGLPIEGTVKVTKPDGSPAVQEPITIRANHWADEPYMERKYLTDLNGLVHYSVCTGYWDNTTRLNIDAYSAELPEEDLVAPHWRRMHQTITSRSLQQWYSPSLSYLSIPASGQPLQCRQPLTLEVPFTHDGRQPTIKFYYQVMSRGRIVTSGVTEAPTHPHTPPSSDDDRDSCLEIKERPTPPPTPSTPAPPSTPTPPTPTEDFTSVEIAPSDLGGMGGEMPPDDVEPLGPEEPGMEPLSPEAPARIQPLSESLDIRRRKRSSPMYPGDHHSGLVWQEDLERSEHVSDQMSLLTLTLPVTPDMSPKVSVLVYYIREDGETVADSQEFEVEPCFNNQVKMEFTEERVMPGSETSLRLEASAGSVCGVGVVDRSVNILGGDHQITPKSVFDKLAEYSLSTHRHHYYSYFRSDDSYCEDRIGKDGHPEMLDKSEEEEGESLLRYPHDGYYTSNFVDAIQAFKQMGMLVLTNLDVETRPCSYHRQIYYYAMPESLENEVAMRSGGAGPEVSDKVRTDFPETWLWDLVDVGETGEANIAVKVPDTITKWVGNSLCINNQTGFGLSPMTSITTFKPFFLNINLPYNAVRGETLPITVTVYNYLDKCMKMELKVDGMQKFKVQSSASMADAFCLCGGLSKTFRFYITAEDIGKLPIFAEAKIVAGQCGNETGMDLEYMGLTDAVQRQVLVKAEGVTQRYSHSMYICPTDGETFSDNFRLPLPNDVVEDSARGDVTVIGDIMGPALDNLDQLVRMPTGCGEQNMVGFTPNIYVLKYLTAAQGLTPSIEEQSKRYMEIGYQRELKYRHQDGSFSAYGPKEDNSKRGSTWLTAFVVKSFAQARPFIFIDEDDLAVSRSYLMSTQNPEEGPLQGCFFEHGEVFSSYMQGGLGKEPNDAALSSYVMIALLEAGLSREDPVAVSGMACINRQLEVEDAEKTDVYTLSLVTYVNVLYDPMSSTTSKAMTLMDNVATVEGDVKYWKRAGEIPKPVNSWYYYAAPSAEVEMTSYALLAILAKETQKEQAVASAQPVVQWLSKQRNSFGGYSSTQDTVLGLNALSEFAEKTISNQASSLRVVVNSGETSADFTVDQGNRLILQRQEIAEITQDSTMAVRVEGSGCALVQANVRYNKLPQKLGIDAPKFRLRADPRNYRHDRNKCNRRTLYITFGQSSGGGFSSGMTMLTVRMVSGWHVMPESMAELRTMYPRLGIQRDEFNQEEGVLNFYLDKISSRTRRFALDLEQEQDLLIRSTKPAEVQIYEYYETDVTAIKSYTLRTTCGTKEELPYDEPANVNDMEQRRQSNAELREERRRLLAARRLQQAQQLGQPQPARTTTAKPPPVRSGNCPVCNLAKAPENYAEIICNSTAVYKAAAGRNRRYSLKIKANLRPRRKQKDLHWFANVRMAPGCQCSFLDPPQKNVLIITQAENLDMERKVLKVDSRTHVFDLRRDRMLEKSARKAQRKCRMN